MNNYMTDELEVYDAALDPLPLFNTTWDAVTKDPPYYHTTFLVYFIQYVLASQRQVQTHRSLEFGGTIDGDSITIFSTVPSTIQQQLKMMFASHNHGLLFIHITFKNENGTKPAAASILVCNFAHTSKEPFLEYFAPYDTRNYQVYVKPRICKLVSFIDTLRKSTNVLKPNDVMQCDNNKICGLYRINNPLNVYDINHNFLVFWFLAQRITPGFRFTENKRKRFGLNNIPAGQLLYRQVASNIQGSCEGIHDYTQVTVNFLNGDTLKECINVAIADIGSGELDDLLSGSSSGGSENNSRFFNPSGSIPHFLRDRREDD